MSFEKRFKYVQDLHKQYAEEKAKTSERRLILEQIIANAQNELKEMDKELDMVEQEIRNANTVMMYDNVTLVQIDDLLNELAVQYHVPRHSLSARANVTSTTTPEDMARINWLKIGHWAKFGTVDIYLSQIDVIYNSKEVSETKLASFPLHADLVFSDGSRLSEHTDFLNSALVRKHNLSKLNVQIDFNDSYMNDVRFRNAAYNCLVRKEQNQNGTLNK